MHASIDRATHALGRLDGLASILPDTAILLYTYIRKEATLSSRIEGIRSSLSDLLLYEAKGVTSGAPHDVQDVSSYVAAMNHGMRRIADGFPVSQRLIREMHAILLSSGRGSTKLPGEFRRSQNWIGGTRPGNAVFVPPPAELVPDLMADLERFIHATSPQMPILVKVGIVHVQFETIHPFLDGNGRLGRLLISLLLLSSGILSQPLLYLSLHFMTHRSRYYDLLQRVRTHGDWESWLAFFLDGIIETATEAATTAGRALELFRNDRKKVGQLGRPAASALLVHRLLQERPIITASIAAREIGISLPAVRRSLAHLEGMGLVKEITGMRRGRAYVYTAYWQLLGQLNWTRPPERGHLASTNQGQAPGNASAAPAKHDGFGSRCHASAPRAGRPLSRP